jgi:hypothetical protein
MSRRNECLIAITDVLDDAGIAYVIRQGSKHLHVVFTIGGREQKCICSVSSPGDWHAPRNARATTRRMIREARP